VSDNKPVKKRSWIQYLLYILAALVVIGLAGFVLYRLHLQSELRARLDAIRAAGYPVTFQELNQWYALPEGGENAANTLLRAFGYYRQWDNASLGELPLLGRKDLPGRTEKMDEETRTLIAQYLAENDRALELLHEGAAIKHCRYPVDFTAGYAISMSHLGDIRTGEKLLQLEAALSAESGSGELAGRSITSMFALARSLSNEPLVLSVLIRCAVQASAVSALEYTLNRIELSDETLAELAVTIDSAEDVSGVNCALVGERCFGIDIFRNPSAQKLGIFAPEVPVAPVVVVYQLTGLCDKDAITYLDVTKEYIEAGQLPLHQRRKAMKAASRKLDGLSKIHLLLRRLGTTVGSTVTMLDVRTIAKLRTARTAVAIERYRLSNGRLPETLAELVPAYLDAVPKDPFDGQDIRYIKRGVGFVVYSIGEDESDDGGVEKQRRRRGTSRAPCDITFIIER